MMLTGKVMARVYQDERRVLRTVVENHSDIALCVAASVVLSEVVDDEHAVYRWSVAVGPESPDASVEVLVFSGMVAVRLPLEHDAEDTTAPIGGAR